MEKSLWGLFSNSNLEYFVPGQPASVDGSSRYWLSVLGVCVPVCRCVCEHGRAAAAEVGGTEVGVGDVVGALHVAANKLGEKGGTAVAKALLNNTTLTDLGLGCE